MTGGERDGQHYPKGRAIGSAACTRDAPGRGISGLCALCLPGPFSLAAQLTCAAADDPAPADASAAPAAPAAPPKAKKGSKTKADHRISVNFKQASWSKVLKRVARHAGLTLVMKHVPPGTFTRNDINQYSVAEVIWILNRELEPNGYRLLHQGQFLMLLDLDGLRSDYRPAVARHTFRDDAPPANSGVQQVGGQQNGKEPGLLETVAPETAHESATSGRDDNDNNDEIAAKKFRIMYLSVPWTQVLPSIANKAGLILVMQRCPGGTFQHPDFREVTFAEALQIINKELDDTNFRLVRQGQFLVVLYTPDLRTEYERPVVGSHRKHVPTNDDTSEQRPPASRNESGVRQVVHETEAWREPVEGTPLSTPGPPHPAAGNDRSHAADSGRACVARSGGRAGRAATEARGVRRCAGHAHANDPLRSPARNGDRGRAEALCVPQRPHRTAASGTERAAELPRV